MPKYKTIQFRVRDEMHNEIQTYCKKNNITASTLLRLVMQKIILEDKPPVEAVKELSFDERSLELDKQMLVRHEKERDYSTKELREMKSTINSIVQYIKTKELKELHSELHPRENPEK